MFEPLSLATSGANYAPRCMIASTVGTHPNRCKQQAAAAARSDHCKTHFPHFFHAIRPQDDVGEVLNGSAGQSIGLSYHCSMYLVRTNRCTAGMIGDSNGYVIITRQKLLSHSSSSACLAVSSTHTSYQKLGVITWHRRVT